MKSFLKESAAAGRSAHLYVSYLNKSFGEDCINNKNKARNYKETVFSSTSGSYYIDGMPATLSQDNEAVLYDDEMCEYY